MTEANSSRVLTYQGNALYFAPDSWSHLFPPKQLTPTKNLKYARVEYTSVLLDLRFITAIEKEQGERMNGTLSFTKALLLCFFNVLQ